MFTLLMFIILPSVHYAAFDYFVLALQWPSVFCYKRHCQIFPIPANFTIHGLWPSNITRTGPMACTSPLTLPRAFRDPTLEQRLDVSWPDLFGSNRYFWQYEWQKHGGCSEYMYPQEACFKFMADLKDKYDVYGALNTAGITPVSRSPTQDVFNTIKAYIGNFNPQLVCDWYYGARISLLLEVRICLDPNGVVIDCPQTTNCYPTIKY